MTRRALALSGGGARIHYHAGVLSHLLGTLRREYQIVTGVSAGAVVAAHIAQYPIGQESFAAESLDALTRSIQAKNVYERWPFGFLQGALKKSFYSSAPLRKTLSDVLSEDAIRKSGRALRIGAVCAETGEFQIFTEKTKGILAAVLASSAFPGVLEPVEIQGSLWMDGGVRVMTPIGAAIEAGATEVDVVLTTPKDYEAPEGARSLRALGIAVRAIDFMVAEIVEKDLKLANYTNLLVLNGVKKNKKVVRLNVIRPTKDLGDSFNFSYGNSVFMRAVGRTDAVSQINPAT